MIKPSSLIEKRDQDEARRLAIIEQLIDETIAHNFGTQKSPLKPVEIVIPFIVSSKGLNVLLDRYREDWQVLFSDLPSNLEICNLVRFELTIKKTA